MRWESSFLVVPYATVKGGIGPTGGWGGGPNPPADLAPGSRFRALGALTQIPGFKFAHHGSIPF